MDRLTETWVENAGAGLDLPGWRGASHEGVVRFEWASGVQASVWRSRGDERRWPRGHILGSIEAATGLARRSHNRLGRKTICNAGTHERAPGSRDIVARCALRLSRGRPLVKRKIAFHGDCPVAAEHPARGANPGSSIVEIPAPITRETHRGRGSRGGLGSAAVSEKHATSSKPTTTALWRSMCIP